MKIKKRFVIIGDNNMEFLLQNKLLLPIYNDGERLTLKSCCDLLNEQDEIINNLQEQVHLLLQENQQLREDNDIKFWKHECIREANTNSIFTFELGKAIDEGYVVSEKFKQMINEWEKETEKMRKKHQRLFE